MKNTLWQDTDEDYQHLAEWYRRHQPLLQIEYPHTVWGDYELEDWHTSRIRLTMEVFKNGKPIGKMPQGGAWGEDANTGDSVIDRAFALYMQRQNRKFRRPNWAVKWETLEEYRERQFQNLQKHLQEQSTRPSMASNRLRDFLKNL